MGSQNSQEEIVDLESRSKQLYELVVTEKFTVLDVIAESDGTSFIPFSGIRIDEEIPVYNGGLTSRLVLEVLPDNPDVPVRTLTFNGFSIVRAGDYISAKIPRYEEKEVGNGLDYRVGEILYLDRAFKPEECAIELAILSDGTIKRRDRAVNYKYFVKE